MIFAIVTNTQTTVAVLPIIMNDFVVDKMLSTHHLITMIIIIISPKPKSIKATTHTWLDKANLLTLVYLIARNVAFLGRAENFGGYELAL